MTNEQLARWAAQEIRQLDELCRSQIPGYEPLDSNEMALLKKLEAAGAGAEDVYPDLRDKVKELEKQVNFLTFKLDIIKGAVG